MFIIGTPLFLSIGEPIFFCVLSSNRSTDQESAMKIEGVQEFADHVGRAVKSLENFSRRTKGAGQSMMRAGLSMMLGGALLLAGLVLLWVLFA